MDVSLENKETNKKGPSIFGIITSPIAQFEKLMISTSIWKQFLFIALLGGLAAALNAYIVQTSPAMMKLAESQSTGFKVPLSVTLGMSVVFGTLAVAVKFFVIAGIYKMIMLFMMNDTTYKKILSIVVYSGIFSIISVFVNSILSLFFGDSYQVNYTSLAPLFDIGTKMNAIAGSFELFSIWGLIITGLGLHIVAGLTKKQSIILVIILFIVTVILGTFPVFLMK
ncbi:YIP1 family protein [Bacillus sp. GMs2/2]|uniref:YIP1 family protein n=1 Tax=Bacillus sp. GMs2/2 TaxID=3418494 RepID=UPI003CEFCD0F